MRPVRLILVALSDLGPEGHRAILDAARIARVLNANLEIFHAIDVSIYVKVRGITESWFETMQQASRKLERIAARLRRCGLQVGTSVEWAYPAYGAIARHSERIGADLILSEGPGGPPSRFVELAPSRRKH